MATPVTNFAKGTVSTGYDDAATSIVLTTGHGSRFPSTFPYPLVWWNSTDYADPADDPDREIVTVTARTSDTLTVTRAAEGTSASNKNTGGKTYTMVLALTKAIYDELHTQSLSQSFRGLRMRTYSVNGMGSAYSSVYFNADAIVMDDGEEISDWSSALNGDLGIGISIASGGAGGLDTGTENASTWYEIYAIYNGTTKSGLFHRAKDWYNDQAYTSGEDGGHILRRSTGNANSRLGQGFQVATAGVCQFVDLRLQRTGTPAGSTIGLQVTIYDDNGGLPGTPINGAISDVVSPVVIPTAACWTRFVFHNRPTLSTSTQYHLVISCDYTSSDSNQVQWRADTTSASYANGEASWLSAPSTWTALSGQDFMFKVYIERYNDAVTMPSGYDRKALIGYAYNDGSEKLVPFSQVDRTVYCGLNANWKLGAFSTGSDTLRSTAAVLPPVHVLAAFNILQATSSGVVRFGTLRTYDLSTTFSTEQDETVTAYCAGNASETAPPIVVEYNALTFITGAATSSPYVAWFTF